MKINAISDDWLNPNTKCNTVYHFVVNVLLSQHLGHF